MKKSIKRIVGLGLTLCLLVSSAFVSFAGEWKQDNIGWWYVNDDGTVQGKGWKFIDNIWYYIKDDGYIAVDKMYHDDGKIYFLMGSGALETNKDYGFASCDGNGVYTIKTYNIEIDGENPYAKYCQQYGIDINGIIKGFNNANEYSYSCSTANFPTNSEGQVNVFVAIDSIKAAVDYHVRDWGVYRGDYTYIYKYDKNTSTFSISFKAVEPTDFDTIIVY